MAVNAYSENTTSEDLLAEFKKDHVIRNVLQMIAVKSGQDREELLQDFAVLLTARMNYVWWRTMSEDEKEMEGIEEVSEQDVADLLKNFQDKYKLSDKYVEHIQTTFSEYVNEKTLKRGENGRMKSGLQKLQSQFFFLRIAFLPINMGINLFDALYDGKSGGIGSGMGGGGGMGGEDYGITDGMGEAASGVSGAISGMGEAVGDCFLQ